MGQPLDGQAHTLAQFARRAGISEGRARALYAATPSGLPRPDRADADGRPLWWASTIDTWCARTGRAVSEDSVWLFRAPAATSPAVELRRGVVRASRYAYPASLYAIVWDTPRGHVIYLQNLDGGGEHRDWLAVHAAELVEPRWWSSAVVVLPMEDTLSGLTSEFKPIAYVYQLTTGSPDGAGVRDQDGPRVQDGAREQDAGGGQGVFGGMRRWLTRTTAQGLRPDERAADERGAGARPRARWAGQLDLSDLAAAVGHRFPMWLSGTATTAHAEQTLSYDRTFTVPDAITEWPAAQHRLETARQAGMPATFPAGFAALAADAADGLQALRTAHENTPSSGPGWYLVCRPARPAPDIALEQIITGARPVTDLDLVAAELAELRAVEAELDIDAPYGDAYYEATQLLAAQLRHAARETDASDGRRYSRHTASSRHPAAAVTDDELLAYSAPWDGPVVQAWRKNLSPVPDLGPVLRLRRIHRLLGGFDDDQVREAYRDDQGRYVLVIKLNHGALWSLAEWPVSLRQARTWTDATVLAGDDDHGTVTTLLALTPTDDGAMRTDPVPLLPHSDRDAFAYGYSGGTPVTTYQALLRIALDDHPDTADAYPLVGEHHPEGQPVSQLWNALSTTTGALRLSWPQIKLWAGADAKTARDMNATRADPPIYLAPWDSFGSPGPPTSARRPPAQAQASAARRRAASSSPAGQLVADLVDERGRIQRLAQLPVVLDRPRR